MKILFPTDFSDAANHAYVYALHLADRLGANVTTLHVYSPPDISGVAHLPHTLQSFYDTIDINEFENYKDSVPSLNEIAKKHQLQNVAVHHVLEEGAIVDTVIEVAIRDEVDLIVMGTTGARGLKEILLGSVAGELLENSPIPVLAVPEEAKFDGAVDNLGFTTVFREVEKNGLRRLLNIFDPIQPHVHVINVDLSHTADIKNPLESWKTSLNDLENINYYILDGTDMMETIGDFLLEKNIDVIAMMTRKRNFWQELFHYSKTKQMSYHGKIPVLSIPESDV